jgi:hypothetical protein
MFVLITIAKRNEKIAIKHPTGSPHCTLFMSNEFVQFILFFFNPKNLTKEQIGELLSDLKKELHILFFKA